MERRVLIVESQNDFALTMAATLKSAGYSTSLAASAADAQRELEKRKPDVVVLRAELPDQSGFVLCGNIRKGRFGSAVPVILIASEVGPEALAQHAQSANAAHGYLAIPFDMNALAQQVLNLAPHVAGSDDVENDLDNALTGTGPQQSVMAGPPPLKTSGPGGPPKLPKRERRSALTDEDKSFLERAFTSIADRKAELLAESREVKRPAARRETMGTPEGKIQILRDELKVREAQIARISEIWSVRERELLSVEDRLNEKDVEIQGLKIQGDDLTKRINDASQNLIEKEREHGAQVEDLLLQKFIGEKEVIEVVSAKEKEINILRREKSAQEEELTRRSVEIDQAKKEFEQLEKDYQLATLEFEVKEKELAESVEQQLANIAQLREQLSAAEQQHVNTVSERDLKFADFDGQIQGLMGTIESDKNERDRLVSELETNLAVSRDHAMRGDQETERLQSELSDTRARSAEQIGNLEGEIMSARQQLESLTQDKAESEATLNETVLERETRIAKIEAEFADITERKDRQEAELQSEIQQRLERIGELEGEVEAVQAALADRETELQNELNELAQSRADLEHQLTQELSQSHGLVASHVASIAALELDLTGRHANISTLNSEVEAKVKHVEALENQIAELQSVVAEREGEIAALKTTNAERDAEIERLEANLTDLGEQLTHTKVTVEETQQALLSNQQALNESQAAFENKSQEQAQTMQALQTTEGSLSQTQGELAQVRGDLEATQQELQGVSSELAQLEQDKATLEDQLNAQLGTVKSALAEAQGNYEAESAAHQKLQTETSADIAQLEVECASLKERIETLQVDLAATKANLDDTTKSLDIERRAHGDTNSHFEERVAALDNELALSRENHEEVSGFLSGTRQELGARVAELTQLNAQLAQGDDQRAALEDRMASLTEESQRQQELLQNDVAAKSKELADTIRKLTTLQQEKTRQVDALTRDGAAKAEQLKQFELKLKSVSDDSKKRTDELTQKVGSMQGEIESVRKELTEKSDIVLKLGEEKTAFASERSELRTQIQTAQQQGNARVQESNAALQQEKAASKKISDELSARAQRAEARIAQVQQESTAKISEYEARLKESQNQMALRQRRVAELEQAIEGSSLTRTKAEKELQSKIAVAEQKANDAAVKLAAVASEKKGVEAQKQKELEDLQTKQRAELDRREQVKAQEVKRLQDAVQEKSKQLKVVELELARYKNKPVTSVGAAPSRPAPMTSPPVARPFVSSPSSASFIGEDEEPATKVNAIPADIQSAARAAIAPRPLATRPSGLAQKPPTDERTMVMAPGTKLPAPKANEEDDFTSIIDNLGD